MSLSEWIREWSWRKSFENFLARVIKRALHVIEKKEEIFLSDIFFPAGMYSKCSKIVDGTSETMQKCLHSATPSSIKIIPVNSQSALITPPLSPLTAAGAAKL
jgi:hypothetical protein